MPEHQRRNSIVKLCVLASVCVNECSSLTIHRKTTRSRRLGSNGRNINSLRNGRNLQLPGQRTSSGTRTEENISEHNIVIPQMMYDNERDLEAILENFLRQP